MLVNVAALSFSQLIPDLPDSMDANVAGQHARSSHSDRVSKESLPHGQFVNLAVATLTFVSL